MDFVLRNGNLIDGTGAPARRADVGVDGGRIAAVGDDVTGNGAVQHVVQIDEGQQTSVSTVDGRGAVCDRHVLGSDHHRLLGGEFRDDQLTGGVDRTRPCATRPVTAGCGARPPPRLSG